MCRSPVFQLIFDSDFEPTLIKKFMETLIAKLTFVNLKINEVLQTAPPTDGMPSTEKILCIVADGLVSIDMNGKILEGCSRDFFYGEQIVRPSSPYLTIRYRLCMHCIHACMHVFQSLGEVLYEQIVRPSSPYLTIR